MSCGFGRARLPLNANWRLPRLEVVWSRIPAYSLTASAYDFVLVARQKRLPASPSGLKGEVGHMGEGIALVAEST